MPRFLVVALLCGAVFLPAWQGVRAEQAQIRVEELPFGTRVSIATDPQGREVVQLPFGSVLRSSLWTVAAIPVCWENPSPSTLAEQKRVQSAIADTWQKESKLRFVGWQTCTSRAAGIHIRISDDWPHTKSLGRYLDQQPQGMVLNFSFSKWAPSCQQQPEFCSWAIAVHEFGHAIGFAHEQNRPDAPVQCQLDAQGTTGDWNVTQYDPSSIMNYCNATWNNNGRLSDRDILAVRTIYGQPY